MTRLVPDGSRKGLTCRRIAGVLQLPPCLLESTADSAWLQGKQEVCELTDVVADERRDELLDGERMEAERRTKHSLAVVSPGVASHREELEQGKEREPVRDPTKRTGERDVTDLDELRLHEGVLDVLSREKGDDEGDELGLVGVVKTLRLVTARKSRGKTSVAKRRRQRISTDSRDEEELVVRDVLEDVLGEHSEGHRSLGRKGKPAKSGSEDQQIRRDESKRRGERT